MSMGEVVEREGFVFADLLTLPRASA